MAPVISMCISQITDEVGYHFIYLWTICVCVKYQFMFVAHFPTGFWSFSYRSVVYYIYLILILCHFCMFQVCFPTLGLVFFFFNSMLIVYLLRDYFSPQIVIRTCLFSAFVVSSNEQKFLLYSHLPIFPVMICTCILKNSSLI